MRITFVSQLSMENEVKNLVRGKKSTFNTMLGANFVDDWGQIEVEVESYILC